MKRELKGLLAVGLPPNFFRSESHEERIESQLREGRPPLQGLQNLMKRELKGKCGGRATVTTAWTNLMKRELKGKS